MSFYRGVVNAADALGGRMNEYVLHDHARTRMNHFTKMTAGARRVGIVGLAIAMSASVALAQEAKPIALGKSMVDPNIRIEVEELKRTADGTVMFKFAVVNDSLRDLDNGFLGAATDMHLVDLVNRRQYGVGMKDVVNTLSSPFPGAKAKSRTEQWAVYGAPPPGVTKLTVMLPNFYPIDDVPLGN